MKDRKDTKPAQQAEDSQDKNESSLGVGGFIGIVLLAGALFNIPSILKIPETTADKMMLVIVLTMAAGGAILLLGSRKK